MNEGNYPAQENLASNRGSGVVRDGCAMPPDQPQLSRGVQENTAQSSPPMPRTITIEAKNHGYVVTVGCQSFAIEKISTLIRNLEKYLERPEETEKKWLKGQLEL